MARENETKRYFGNNPVTRMRPDHRDLCGEVKMNTFEKLTSLKQSGKPPETGRLLTTPEAIVRDHREMMRRMAPGDPAPRRMPGEKEEEFVIYGRRPDPVHWSERINWDYLLGVICIGCSAAVVAVGIYVVVWHIIPFVETLRWGN